ncbi:TATA box-binding protein-associated factor RNA polymerase I subunit D [Hemicordylus capensis]|uniref:TATA box-binding protein-associated factor RNA polymerase I subunit D n=1 Tax=Hemicordylus capensis TaxID=884348 RepID=UPI0023037275|nr:TATA box-binding protein-associated factor RNA polymerase I subunit D [Hemicordylus capensis]XP_053165906.1 TATA box-binding protein-associated factor RNA polymerase I subunit D [Hemicordylus capensis]XP_053165907.1 TATA box-binding protein-associated factor RNA polymerase I subunit D [Hemicordylus capensis]
MADTDEMESSLLEDLDGLTNGHSSQSLPQVHTSTGAVPRNREPEMTDPGSPSLQCSRKKAKTRRSARRNGRSSEKTSNPKTQGGPSTCSSVKSGGQLKLPKPKLDLKALFDYHFRRKSQRRRRSWKLTEEVTRRKRRRKYTLRPRFRISAEERKRRYRERGLQFPFVEKLYGRKHIPLKMVCRYEEAALKGFLKYVKMLRFEHQLKTSLTQLNAGDDLEKECLESRKHKYLDEDGPLSPIEEADGSDQNDDEEIGAKIVDNSCFILSSNIPKKKSKRRTNTSSCKQPSCSSAS